MRFLSPATLLPLLLVSGPAVAQHYRWTQMLPATSPVGRRDHAMVFDAARGVTILFGGYREGYLGDMWTYDGATWRELTPATLPSRRAQAAAAYDPLRGKVVLLGGTDGTTLTDVWEWDGTDWTRVATGPNLLQPGGSAAYDPALGGVLYNLDSVNLLWDGVVLRVLTVSRPDGGQQHVLVYDAAGGGVLTQVGQYTKRFVGGVGWEEVLVSFGWGVRQYAMAADPVRGRVALTGGNAGMGQPNTSIWLGSGWWTVFQYDVGPGNVRHAAMVFDLRRNAFVHFGGSDAGSNYYAATWELAELPVPPATYNAFGAGCSGSSSYLPALHADPLLGPRPVLGGSLMLRLEGMPPFQPVVGLLGSSRTSWGGVSLPFNLGWFGMLGCWMLVAPDLMVPLGSTSAGGIAWWRTAIPNNLELAGQMFFQQAAVLVPGANPPGVLWSNAGEGMFGGR